MNKNMMLYAGEAHVCNYLPEQLAQLLFVDPHAEALAAYYHQLIQQGFRRSGRYIYRPGCSQCQQCQSVRVPTHSFQANRSQRRVWSKNQDLSISKELPTQKDEYLLLYQKYQRARHRKDEEIETSNEDYLPFLTSDWSDTWFLEFRLGEKLLAVGVIDQTNTGLSAVYTFFDPDYSARSLGTYAVLREIELAKQMELPFLYLGYWIEQCGKMNYKSRFQPLEILIEGKWVKFTIPHETSRDAS